MIENQNQDLTVTFQTKTVNSSSQSVMSSPQKLIPCLGHMLTRLIQQAPVAQTKQSRFYCKTKPAIGVNDYLKRIYRFAGCSQYIFLKALIYIDRFQNAREDFSLNEFSLRQVMCAVMIAAKYSEDFYYTNKHYSKVGGISEDDINKLEREFLDSINFSLYVDRQQLDEYQQKLNAYYELMMYSDQKVGDHYVSPARTQGTPTPR